MGVLSGNITNLKPNIGHLDLTLSLTKMWWDLGTPISISPHWFVTETNMSLKIFLNLFALRSKWLGVLTWISAFTDVAKKTYGIIAVKFIAWLHRLKERRCADPRSCLFQMSSFNSLSAEWKPGKGYRRIWSETNEKARKRGISFAVMPNWFSRLGTSLTCFHGGL